MIKEIFKIKCADLKQAPKIFFENKIDAEEYLIKNGFLQISEVPMFFKMTDGWFEEPKLITATISSILTETFEEGN